MDSFCERSASSVNLSYVLFVLCLFLILVISQFGFIGHDFGSDCTSS